MESRYLTLFENSCKSPGTFKTFTGFINTFLKWAKLDYDSLLALPQIDLENLLQDYTMYLKKRTKDGEISANTVPHMIQGIFKFLKVNCKKFDKEAITQLFPERVKEGGAKAITDEQIQQLLDSTGDKRDKALVHILSATGARPEALVELQMKNIENYDDGFLKLTLYKGDYKHEYVTFLHPEAVRAFKEYIEWRRQNGEIITPESFAFRNNLFSIHPTHQLNSATMHTFMHRLYKMAKINRTKDGKRYDVATFTGFRKRFDTRLELNPDISQGTIQCLMDHTGYLSGNYRKPTTEQMFNEYKKAVKDLIVTKEWKLKLEISKIKSEKNSKKDERIEQLEKALEKQEMLLTHLLKKFN